MPEALCGAWLLIHERGGFFFCINIITYDTLETFQYIIYGRFCYYTMYVFIDDWKYMDLLTSLERVNV